MSSNDFKKLVIDFVEKPSKALLIEVYKELGLKIETDRQLDLSVIGKKELDSFKDQVSVIASLKGFFIFLIELSNHDKEEQNILFQRIIKEYLIFLSRYTVRAYVKWNSKWTHWQCTLA